jgi:hypothetical protein
MALPWANEAWLGTNGILFGHFIAQFLRFLHGFLTIAWYAITRKTCQVWLGVDLPNRLKNSDS